MAQMIDNYDLASMRSALEDLMPDSADIYRKTVDKVGGDAVKNLVLVGEGVPCRVMPAQTSRSGKGAFMDDRQEAQRNTTSHILTFPVNADVQAKDIVKVNGLVLHVENAGGAGDSYATCIRCPAKTVSA